METNAKKLASRENMFSLLWKRCNVLIGYIIAIILTVVFWVCWSFNQYVFIISLIWGLSFLRLRFGNIEIKRMNVVIMWSIFCFGFIGIIMQLLKIDGCLALSGIVSGLVAITLYCYIPLWSSFLKYQKFDNSLGVEQKHNGHVLSVFIYIVTLFIVAISISELQEKRENQKIVWQQESFVPVKKISEEMYDGCTFYILEAKGQRFKVSPFEYPEVRDINQNSQVKVLLGDNNDFGLKEVKKVQFKN